MQLAGKLEVLIDSKLCVVDALNFLYSKYLEGELILLFLVCIPIW